MLDRQYPTDPATRTKSWRFFTILSVIAFACISCNDTSQQTSSSQRWPVQPPRITEGGRMPLTDSAPTIPTALIAPPSPNGLATDTPTVLATTIPISYEAEALQNTRASGARVISCSGCSGGYRVGDLGLQSNGTSGTLQFNNVWEPRTDNYPLVVYYTDGATYARYFDISVNGGQGKGYRPPNTGDWNTVGTYKITITLNAGSNTILFYNVKYHSPDIDRIAV